MEISAMENSTKNSGIIVYIVYLPECASGGATGKNLKVHKAVKTAEGEEK